MDCCPNCGSNLTAYAPIHYGNVTISQDGTVMFEGRRVKLTRTLHEIAECIIRGRGRGITCGVLAARLGSDVFDGSIKKNIQRLRCCFRAINPRFDQIEALHGFGAYRWRFKAADVGTRIDPTYATNPRHCFDGFA